MSEERDLVARLNSNQALRTLEPAIARFRDSPRAQLTSHEWDALLRLIELHKDLVFGTPGTHA
jgi:hypothetical protein